jgi:hypothetical protein
MSLKSSIESLGEVEIDYPSEYTCPIGHNLIEEAVIDLYGNTYDKVNIYRWLEQKAISPLTNQPLIKENLVPNRFLQDLIIKFKQENDLIGKKIKVKEYKTLAKKDYIFDKESFIENLVFNNKIFKLENDYYLNINIKMPKENPTGKHYIICLDISGSMGMEATVKDASGSESSQGLSLLKIAIHATKTLIASLSENDLLSIVTFHADSDIIESVIEYNEHQKVRIFDKLDKITTKGTTNLEAGLNNCYNLCSTQKELFNNIIVFTDGRPNSIKKTWSDIIDNNIEKYNVNPRIDTIGFSYNIEVDTLNLISSHTNGTFSFIPDPGMISDIMINYISRSINMLVDKSSIEIEINIPSDFTFSKSKIYGIESSYYCNNNVILKTGSLISEQNKNILIKLNQNNSGTVFSNLNNINIIINKNLIKKSSLIIIDETPNKDQILRYEFLELLELILKNGKRTLLDQCKTLIIEFLNKYDDYESEIIKDVEGQVLQSVSKNDYWELWGYKYIISLLNANNNEYCNNYKDFSIKNYLTESFENDREKISKIFDTLPAPVPDITNRYPRSSTVSYQSVDMSSFNNRGGVCFTANNTVIFEKGYHVNLDKLKKGDRILTDNNEYDEIECILKTDFTKFDNSKTHICKINFNNNILEVTPNHPILLDTNEDWIHPQKLVQPELIDCDYVYSFLMKSRKSIIINNIKCSTLAHGLQDNIVYHEYFGSEKVVEDLKKLNGWDQGEIIITPNNIIRNKVTNYIEGIK